MTLGDARWQVIAESNFAWEREALDWLRSHLPDRNPWRVWTHFEFIDDEGKVNEVDALVLSPVGLFLVEIKSRPGVLTGDAHSWTWTTDGRSTTVDNPLLLANRKAKRLASLLRRQPAITKDKIRLPFVEPAIFLSSSGLSCRLEGLARTATFQHGRPGTPDDPGIVGAGDRLDGGFTVIKRLGRGSSSDALLAHKKDDGGDAEYVLKVACDVAHNDRLVAEGEVLARLRHPNIVAHRATLAVAGRTALLLESAGHRTMAVKLKEDGRLSLDLLQRFGEELIEAVKYLEAEGVAHRDIRPENIGIAESRTGKLQLVLFDFSLCRTPADNVTAGTHPYLDPFLALRRPPRWDLYAERFALAVTLYEMAVGRPPVWGDGQTSPAMLDVEATVESDVFDPVTREGFTAFFAKALKRDYRERFDNAEDLLRAWRAIFAARQTVHPDDASAAAGLAAIAMTATPHTTMAELGYSLEAQDLLERMGVHNARELLAVDRIRFRYLRGVGDKIRKEIRLTAKELARRRPDLTQDRSTAHDAEAHLNPPRFEAFDHQPCALIASAAAWADYARQLGAAADACALADPLLPPRRALETLEGVPLPLAPDAGAAPAAALAPARLLRLATSAARRAALSSRQEIYPRDMAPLPALRQSLGALVGARQLRPDEIQARVRGRYPEAVALPGRPELDRLLVLTVHPRLARRAESELLHRFGQPGTPPGPLRRVNFDALLLAALREQAAAARIDWPVVLEADAAERGSRDWSNLQRLVQRTRPALRAALLQSTLPILLVNAGLLARYELMTLITEMEEKVGRPDQTPGVWLLLPTVRQGLPAIDGVAVPLVNNMQNSNTLALAKAWVKNTPRASCAPRSHPE